MFSRGYDHQDLDRCLADEALAQRLKAISARAISAGVTKSPSFSINGNLLSNSHDWAKLRLQLDESLK
jgi:2-hydroxychromene-2-carboxylate isomerase